MPIYLAVAIVLSNLSLFAYDVLANSNFLNHNLSQISCHVKKPANNNSCNVLDEKFSVTVNFK